MSLFILDRDGVINYDSDLFVKSPEEWIPIPGSLEAIADLGRAGHTVAVATNQSGLARGYFDESTLAAIHQKFISLLESCGGQIDHLVYCPHGPDDDCQCRKPLPGLYLQIAAKSSMPLDQAFVIGDSLRDLQAAVAVDAQPCLVLTGKGEKTIKSTNLPENTKIFSDLATAVEALL